MAREPRPARQPAVRLLLAFVHLVGCLLAAKRRPVYHDVLLCPGGHGAVGGAVACLALYAAIRALDAVSLGASPHARGNCVRLARLRAAHVGRVRHGSRGGSGVRDRGKALLRLYRQTMARPRGAFFCAGHGGDQRGGAFGVASVDQPAFGDGADRVFRPHALCADSLCGCRLPCLGKQPRFRRGGR